MQLTYVLAIDMAVAYMFSWFAALLGKNKDRNLSKTESVISKILILAVFLTLFTFGAFRHVTGINNDELVYRGRMLEYATYTLGDILKNHFEFLTTVPVWIMAHLTQNTQWYMIFMSFFTYLFFVYGIKKYCDNFEFGILLLFLLNVVNLTFNISQQMMATAVLMLGMRYMYERKFWKFFAVVMVATLIHSSAIIMIGIYFLAHMKPWSGRFVGISFASVVFMSVFNTVIPQLLAMLGFYDSYYNILRNGGGVKAITIVFAFVPIGAAFIFRKHLPKDDAQLNCCINVALLYALIYLISSQQIYVARFASYLFPWLIVLFTKLLTYLRKAKLAPLFYYFTTLAYGATFVYYTSTYKYEFLLKY